MAEGAAEKVRVGVRAGPATWGFQYLRGAPGADRLGAARLGRGAADRRRAAPAEPEADPRAQDVLILADLPVSAAHAGRRAVGGRHRPRRPRRQRDPAGRRPLPGGVHQPPDRVGPAAVPPVVHAGVARVAGRGAAFRFIRTGDGERLGARLEDEGDADEGGLGRWQQLPGSTASCRSPSRSCAPTRGRCWWRSSRARRRPRAGREQGAGRPDREPHQQRRAYYFGGRESWRLAVQGGPARPRPLLGAARPQRRRRPVRARSGVLALDLDRVSAEPGQPVKARFRVFDEDVDASAFRLEVLRGGAVVASQPLAAGRGRGRRAMPARSCSRRWALATTVRLVGPGRPPERQQVSTRLHRRQLRRGTRRRLARRGGAPAAGRVVGREFFAARPGRPPGAHQRPHRRPAAAPVEHPLWRSRCCSRSSSAASALVGGCAEATRARLSRHR